MCGLESRVAADDFQFVGRILADITPLIPLDESEKSLCGEAEHPAKEGCEARKLFENSGLAATLGEPKTFWMSPVEVLQYRFNFEIVGLVPFGASRHYKVSDSQGYN